MWLFYRNLYSPRLYRRERSRYIDEFSDNMSTLITLIYTYYIKVLPDASNSFCKVNQKKIKQGWFMIFLVIF